MSTTAPWIVITVANLESYLVAAQVEAIRTAATDEENPDRFVDVMPAIAARIRNKVKRRNKVSATANSIPPELKWVACYLIIEAMQTSLPGLDLTEDQRTQIERAVSELNRVEDGKSFVSAPDDPLEPTDVQSPGGITVVSGNRRIATRETMDGL